MTPSELPDIERIAVVGMAGRFPRSRDLEEYWRNLRDGVECISFSGGDETSPDPTFVPAGGVLDGLDLFDAPFFGLSARDAEAMDPQQRVFLECAWHSLEDAGYNPDTYPGLIGVYAGAALSFYMSDLYANPAALMLLDDFQIAIGNDKDHLTTQTAYKLNLRGPSLTVQTACSTSLVAVCLACQSLLDYHCDMALAGGVAADVTTGDGYHHQPGGIFSSDGHCRAFDAAAEGTVPGNGVGVVVLKRLSDALADRDRIRAVIAGFALNNDGSRKVGYTAPSVDGQAEVIAMAHAMAGVHPESVTYLEAHGTGTALGDPIEIAALNQVFAAATRKRGYCAIGSVKSNIGHLDTAAGIASLIKTVLALEHRSIPPTLHFEHPNPEIDFGDTAFAVNARLTDWAADGGPRTAGVSSFGIGGTNAHVVVQEAPPARRPVAGRTRCLLTLSTRTEAALEAATDDLAEHLRRHPEVSLADTGYTCHVGRKPFAHRRVAVVEGSNSDAAATLASRDPRHVLSRECDEIGRPVFFLLPGQGTQAVGMAGELYRVAPSFRETIDRCAELVSGSLELDLRHVLYPRQSGRRRATAALDRTAYTQPALFVVEYALARLWMEWGVAPAAMLGHSIGEWVAACLAGVLSLDDALRLVVARGRLMDELPSGGMLAVALPESAARRHLDDRLSLAAINGPNACVLSGPSDALDELAAVLDVQGTATHRLATSHAFHSEMMQPAIERFVEVVRDVPLTPPRIPFVSNVTGSWITPREAADPVYWGRQLRETVRFSDGLSELVQSADAVLLEVGSGQTLGNLARRHPGRDPRQPVLSSLPGAHRTSDEASLLTTLGALWLHGVEPDWDSVHARDDCRRVALPLYPFDRQRYWIGPPTEDEAVDEEPGALVAEEEPGEWLFYPGWRPAPPASPRGDGDTGIDTDTVAGATRWMVFGDESPLATHLIDGLRDQGGEVVRVGRGELFTRAGETGYVIDPARRTDYEDLLRDAADRFGPPDAIVHLWTAQPADIADGDRDAVTRHQDAGLHSVIWLAQALERLGMTSPLTLNVVSSAVHAVIGGEALCPANATMVGACRVITQELPYLACRFIDVDPSAATAGAQLAATILGEVKLSSSDPVVAYRNGRRWTQTFDAAYLESDDAQPRRTRPGGVYLITGGLGNVGLVLAGFLARTTPKVTLVLTGRSTMPDEDDWEGWLGREPESAIAARIEGLMTLRATGAGVAYFSADVADPARMSDVIEAAEKRYGPIRGVVHAAGDTDALFAVNELDRAAIDQQFRSKVDGLIVLDELLRGRDLDFCVLISSLSSFVGGVGLAAYAAANCFMDALAARRNQEGGVPWVSVNWGAWHFPAAQDAEPPAAGNGILPAQGEAAFGAILARAPRQIVVSTRELAPFDVAGMERAEPELPSPDEMTVYRRPALSNAYVAPRSSAERDIAEIWQDLLGVAPIGVFDNFFELGGHSLLAIQLVSRLRSVFAIDVPVRRVFDLPTTADLAGSFAGGDTGLDADRDRAAELLTMVEGLSEDDVRLVLEREGASE